MNFGRSRRILWLVEKLPDIEPDSGQLGEIGGKAGVLRDLIFDAYRLAGTDGKGKRQEGEEEGEHLLKSQVETKLGGLGGSRDIF